MSHIPRTRSTKKSWTVDERSAPAPEAAKKGKFDFAAMKVAATSEDPSIRKAEFVDYFERFNEFPSFLFDTDHGIDPRLAETIRDLSDDTSTSKALRDGIAALVQRLPA